MNIWTSCSLTFIIKHLLTHRKILWVRQDNYYDTHYSDENWRLEKRKKTGGSGRKVASFNVNRSTQLGVNYIPFAFYPLIIFTLAYNADNRQRDIKLIGQGMFFSSPKILVTQNIKKWDGFVWNKPLRLSLIAGIHPSTDSNNHPSSSYLKDLWLICSRNETIS